MLIIAFSHHSVMLVHWGHAHLHLGCRCSTTASHFLARSPFRSSGFLPFCTVLVCKGHAHLGFTPLFDCLPSRFLTLPPSHFLAFPSNAVCEAHAYFGMSPLLFTVLLMLFHLYHTSL